MPLADVTFGELALLVFEVFVLMVWIWILVTIITDLFRDHELSGWWKALWVFFLLFIPFLTGFVYLGVRGNGMDDRAMEAISRARGQSGHAVQEEVRSPASELDKLQGLREGGTLTDTEFETARARLPH